MGIKSILNKQLNLNFWQQPRIPNSMITNTNVAEARFGGVETCRNKNEFSRGYFQFASFGRRFPQIREFSDNSWQSTDSPGCSTSND